MRAILNKFFVKFILNIPPKSSYIEDISLGNEIPKIIHQTFSSKKLPTQIQKNVENIKFQNPDWVHKFYDDGDRTNYIESNFPELLKYYLSISPDYGAARADFFRYLVIYKEGGVYLDIKSGLSKPLDDIIKESDSLILSHWTQYDPRFKLGFYKGIQNQNGELQQWHIISVSGHPILKKVINTVCSNIQKYNPLLHGTGKMGVLRLTGPIAYTGAITPLISVYPCRVELSHEKVGLIYNVLDTYDIHHQAFGKQHYSYIKKSIIKQSTFINLLLCIQNFIKSVLKTLISKLNNLRH